MAAIFLAVVSITLSASVVASGGGGGFSGGFTKPVDEYYELGKSYFRSRQANGTQLEYCVLTANDGLKKLSRRSVKSFRNGPESAFVSRLLDCSEPAVKIVEVVSADQSDAILYYLNKRFELRLQNS